MEITFEDGKVSLDIFVTGAAAWRDWKRWDRCRHVPNLQTLSQTQKRRQVSPAASRDF